MANWYYYDNNGQKQGPVTGGQLKGLANAGMITPETVVETEEGKKAPARKVQGLTFVCPPSDIPSTMPVKVENAPHVPQPVSPSPFIAVPTQQSPVVPAPNVSPLTQGDNNAAMMAMMERMIEAKSQPQIVITNTATATADGGMGPIE